MIDGGRKQFSDELYDKYDGPAKEVVIKFLQKRGWMTSSDEDFCFDINAYRDSGIYCLDVNHHEVEVKPGWDGDWPAAWNDVRIPERKMRLLQYMRGDLYFWVLSRDLSRSWMIGYKVFENAPKEIRVTKYTQGELFAIIPVCLARLIVF